MKRKLLSILALLLIAVSGAWSQTMIYYELSDSYGDGWNSAGISVINTETEEQIAFLTFDDGDSFSDSFEAPDGCILRFEWLDGYSDSETSYNIYDDLGNSIVNASGGEGFPVYYPHDPDPGNTDPVPDADPGMYIIRYQLNDEYGDGWNGANIKVTNTDTNEEVITLTLSEGNSNNGYFQVPVGCHLKFEWNPCGDGYDYEASYKIYDEDDNTIVEGSGGEGGFPVEYAVPNRYKIFYELSDQYNDGWNGAYIKVTNTDTNEEVITLAMADGESSKNGSLIVPAGCHLQFEWVQGNYDSECSYRIYDENGNTIVEGSGGGGFPLSYTVPDRTLPICAKPTDLAVTDGSITTTEATVTWNGDNDGYVVMIGPKYIAIDADFETGNLSQANFTTTSSYPWTVVENNHSGAYCIKSSNSGIDDSESDMVAEVTLVTDMILRFSARVSSEYYDRASFSIDGNVQSDLDNIYGNGSWIDYSYPLTAGTHTLKWSYMKNWKDADYDDCFYVDDIVLANEISWSEYTTTDNTYTFSNLNHNTTYYVKVKGFCEPDSYSDETDPISFTTVEVTYDVTLADGTFDADNWAITPAPAGEGKTVTLSYAGQNKVKNIAVKQEGETVSSTLDGVFDIIFQANGNTKTIENVTLPRTFMCNAHVPDELDLIIMELYGWSSGNINGTINPTVTGSSNVTAGWDDRKNDYITVNAPFNGTTNVVTGYRGNGVHTQVSLNLSVRRSAVVVPVTNRKWTFTMPDQTMKVAVDYETNLALNLSEETDNEAALAEWDGYKANATLTRTLKAGSWNTFSVPFAISNPAGVFGAGVKVKQLTGSTLNNGQLELSFADAESIEPCKPYLVLVQSDVPLSDMTFDDVVVCSTAEPTETSAVDFIPIFGFTSIGSEGDNPKSVLFLGSGNKLHFPNTMPMQIKGFRAYYQGKDIASVRSFKLDLGEESTGISEMVNREGFATAPVYDLQGRRVDGAAKKGVYVENGKKVIVK